MLDSSLLDEDEAPEPLEVWLSLEVWLPLEVPDDSELVEVPLEVDAEDALSAVALFAAAFLVAALAVELELLARRAADAVVLFLLESAGSCPEAIWT